MAKSPKIEIQELFMAKAGKNGWDRCFYGTIQRLKSEDGSDYCIGKIKVNNGFVCARASNQEELGRKLDELVRITLDYNLMAILNTDSPKS